ncbi:MAG: flavin reductase family protein [Chloroflexi bacterium]|nr:flavin reductase family protein [Chloroflexota bacterium]
MTDRLAHFRSAWGRFATGVTAITTVETDGKIHGMTANGVTSVSLDPPLALAAVGRSRNTYGLIKSTGRFGLSILSLDQRSIAEYFVRPAAQRTGDVVIEYEMLDGVWPVIRGAIAQMGCTVSHVHESGDHAIFVVRVEAMATHDGEPLVFYRGRYTSLE